MLSSRDKKDLSFFSKKGPIFLKKGVKKGAKKSKSGRIFKLFSIQFGPLRKPKILCKQHNK
jgi:hypothetical protein